MEPILNKFIQIISVKTETKTVNFCQINFFLDTRLLNELQGLKNARSSLVISRKLRVNIKKNFTWDLIFCTYWQQQPIVKTTIFFPREIINQICLNNCHNPELPEIFSLHHWLIQIVIEQLTQKVKIPLNLIAWSIAILSLIIVILFHLNRLNNLNFWHILALLVMTFLWQWANKKILKLFLPQLSNWLWQYF